MMKALLLLAAIWSAYAGSPAFEVISIKPSPPENGSVVNWGGGPGTRDQGRWRCENMPLREIVHVAFNVASEQLVTPDWMNESRFDIIAKIPSGATREQLNQMLQNMLIERFGLKFHRDQKEFQGYRLVVAKNGPKFKESVSEPPKDPSPPETPAHRPASPALGADGFPVVAPGVSDWSMINGRGRAQLLRATIPELVANLESWLGAPVIDGTGLNGQYDLGLHWVGSARMMVNLDGGPSLLQAVQNQLGLKLERKKLLRPIIVVDHSEKFPSEN